MDKNLDYLQGKDLINFLNAQTFETIQDRQLQAFPDIYDKREGSIAWDIFAPFSIEERLIFLQLLWIWKNMFADTADRQSLIRLAKMRNVDVLPATNATVEGAFNRKIPRGARFNYEDINFTTADFRKEQDGKFYYVLECETAGESGNVSDVDISPIENIQGLNYARITRILIPGEEEEDTEALRKRYYESIRQRDYGFNISQYVHQTDMLPGVGGTRVYPATPEPGHVTLYITDSSHNPPTDELVRKVQEILDPVPKNQQGVGRVPIGHYVHVNGAKKDSIIITVKMTFSGSFGEAVKDRVKENVEEYLKKLREEFEDTFSGIHPTLTQKLIVRESFLETYILSLNDSLKTGQIIDVKVTAINGKPGNYEVSENALPVLENIVYEE